MQNVEPILEGVWWQREPIVELNLSLARRCRKLVNKIKMHDFCFTIPYGTVLVIGGIIGFVTKSSLASLAGGSGTGLLLILAGYLSLTAFERRRNSWPALILETLCAITVTLVMGQRYLLTSKIMPAGIVAAISALMTAFYLFKIATGGNHIPPKKE